MPNALLMNLDSNRTQGEHYRMQIAASEPLKKGLWKQIVETKIRNQAALLRKLGYDGDKLKPCYMNVKSADADNREGIAARIYWSELFGAEFYRSREGSPPNNLLNYGYTILRAAVARAIMGSGLFPAFGIFHRNRYNSLRTIFFNDSQKLNAPSPILTTLSGMTRLVKDSQPENASPPMLVT